MIVLQRSETWATVCRLSPLSCACSLCLCSAPASDGRPEWVERERRICWWASAAILPLLQPPWRSSPMALLPEISMWAAIHRIVTCRSGPLPQPRTTWLPGCLCTRLRPSRLSPRRSAYYCAISEYSGRPMPCDTVA